MGESIGFNAQDEHNVRAWRSDSPAVKLPVCCAHGYIWVCLGEPTGGLFAIPEYLEPDRRNVCAATIGVRVSAPRAVENFLDMGHFPYVHTGMLGEQPHTEVREYDVDIKHETNEIIATRCRFYQLQAAAGAEGGMLVEYIYRVPHPYCAILYKSCPSDETRLDVVALFLQPVGEEQVRAHALKRPFGRISPLLCIDAG